MVFMPVGATKEDVPEVKRIVQVPSLEVLSMMLLVVIFVPSTEQVPVVTIAADAADK
jgi:ribosomal protein L10